MVSTPAARTGPARRGRDAPCPAAGANHDFLEARFPVRRLGGARRRGEHPARGGPLPAPRPPAGAPPTLTETLMTWTTPTATEFRFGFEITMYVAAR